MKKPIAPGKRLNGVVGYQAPEDWKVFGLGLFFAFLELRYFGFGNDCIIDSSKIK